MGLQATSFSACLKTHAATYGLERSAAMDCRAGTERRRVSINTGNKTAYPRSTAFIRSRLLKTVRGQFGSASASEAAWFVIATGDSLVSLQQTACRMAESSIC